MTAPRAPTRALAAGIELAKLHGAELWALAVQERLPRFSGTIDEVQEEKEFANEQYGQLLDGAPGPGPRKPGVELQDPHAPRPPGPDHRGGGQGGQV